MSSNTTITGNAVRPPELKFLTSGQAAVKLSVAVNRRWQNRQTQEWEERTSYFDVVAYGSLAENVANSVEQGTRVTVTGRLEQRTWETDKGEKRSVIEINADDISVSLAYANASVTKNERKESAGSSFRKAPTTVEDAF